VRHQRELRAELRRPAGGGRRLRHEHGLPESYRRALLEPGALAPDSGNHRCTPHAACSPSSLPSASLCPTPPSLLPTSLFRPVWPLWLSSAVPTGMTPQTDSTLCVLVLVVWLLASVHIVTVSSPVLASLSRASAWAPTPESVDGTTSWRRQAPRPPLPCLSCNGSIFYQPPPAVLNVTYNATVNITAQAEARYQLKLSMQQPPRTR